MGNSLLIPFHIEAKFLLQADVVRGPLLNYANLPYWDSIGNQVNFKYPFLGDSINTEPFTGASFKLPAGVHLHFILPQFLGRPIPKNSGLDNAGELAAAPNRWLVKKTISGNSTYWLIQSDYIYDPSNDPIDTDFHTSFLYKMPDPTVNNRPYCYIGRVLDASDSTQGGDVLDTNSFRGNNIITDSSGKTKELPLTITGSGNINFSSFYPNCNKVFGFYDADITDLNTNQPTYEVFGWNDRKEDDLLSTYIQKAIADNVSNLGDQLKTLFSINIENATDTDYTNIQNQSIYYAKIKMDGVNNHNPFASLDVTIGASGTEALSAWIASDSQITKKAEVEEQLESVNLFSNLNHLLGDIGPKFHEARHTQGFRRIAGGHKWIINRNTSVSADTSTSPTSVIPLPEDLVNNLDALNKAQEAYDKGQFELQSLQEQLYMDWTKYMHQMYSENSLENNSYGNTFSDFIQNYATHEVQDKIYGVGLVTIDTETGTISLDPSSKPTSLAVDLYNKWNTIPQNNVWTIQLAAAEPYWQPKAPVILLSNLNEDGTEDDILRNAGENVKTIYISDFDSSDAFKISANLQNLSAYPQFSQKTGSFTLKTYSTQSTNPFILEWAVKMNALYENPTSPVTDISSSVIVDNTEIKSLGADLNRTTGTRSAEPSQFNGRVIMSQGSRKAMVHNIIEFLKFYAKSQTKPDDNSIANKILDLFKTSSTFSSFQSSIDNLISNTTFDYTQTLPIEQATLFALHKIVHTNFLSQTLSGFNHACLMQKLTAQLPVIDPFNPNIGSYDPKKGNNNSIEAQINNVLGDIIRTSTYSDNPFYPIRSGEFEITMLDLIDNFGVISPVLNNTETINTVVRQAETLTDTQNNNTFLPPRITQASRVQFNWLNAIGNAVDDNNPLSNYVISNSHDLSTPICGWLVPNYFNNDLMVFDSDGNALGNLDVDANWNLPPSAAYACNIEANIDNEHLRRVVKWLSANASLLKQFVSSMQTAQDNSSPAHAHVYSTKTLLMGRPIAVARAIMSIELKGLPAINQNNDIFDTDCTTNNFTLYNQRNNNKWNQVQIPFRLGEHFQLDDGLLGYWKEDGTDTLKKLVAPESSDTSKDDSIKTFSMGDKMQETSTFDKANIFTILLDPRSGVHITSGVLPTLKKAIAPDHFLPQLKKIQMWFKVFPLLQPNSTLTKSALLNLPKIDDCTWQWYDQFGNLRTISSDEIDKLSLSDNTLTESILILNNNQ
jgi:hypothetical protein